MCNIPVLSIAEKLIDKYAAHPECMERKRVFPVSSNQRMNGYLKELADLCGITKNLTTHTARHRISYYQLKTSRLRNDFSQ
jgi:site-specific recombinase XerD